MATSRSVENKRRLFTAPPGQAVFLFVIVLQCFILLTSPPNLHSQDAPSIISYVAPNAVYLRWEGLRSPSTEGFLVYRRASADAEWTPIVEQPITRITEINAINAVLGELRGNVILALYGAGNPPQNLNNAIVNNLFANDDALSLLKVVSLVNWDFGFVNGEICIDSTLGNLTAAQYRVSALENGQESEIGQTELLTLGRNQVIPPVDFVDVRSGESSAQLEWPRPFADMRRGDIVTFNVYRSDDELGPFDQVNLGAYLPLIIESGENEGVASSSQNEYYEDKYLNKDELWYYYVTSVNAFGFESAPGPTVEVRIGGETLGKPRAISHEVFGSGVRFKWKAPTRGLLRGYEVWKREKSNGEFNRVHPISDALFDTSTTWFDPILKTGVSYQYFLRSAGLNDQLSQNSDTLTITLADKQPPTQPQNLVALADTGQIRLRWNAVPDEDLLGYTIERASDAGMDTRFQLNKTYITDTTFIDSLPPESQTTYAYVVTAVDASYNRSMPSQLVAARLPDIVPPPAPFVTRFERLPNSRDLLIEWTPLVTPDLQSYRLQRQVNGRNDIVNISAAETARLQWTMPDSGRVAVSISSVDSSGNVSNPSREYSLTMPLSDGPDMPQNGTVASENGKLRVQWESGADSRAAGFVIMRQDIASGKRINVAQLRQDARSFVDRTAETGRDYRFEIQAHDEKWRMSRVLVVEYFGAEE